MISAQTYVAFVVTASLFVLSPGPGVLFVLATGMANGVARSLIAIAGMLLMHLLFLLVTFLGLAALVSTSAELYEIIKYAGAAYLVFLGVKAWRSRPALVEGQAAAQAPGRLFLQGMATSGTNPKSLMFYLALFPQFVAPGSGPGDFLPFGAILLAALALGLTTYAALARGVRDWLLQGDRLRLQSRITGTIFILAGLALAGFGL